MVQTVKTIAQLLAEFPENTLRLIHPVAARDLTVSAFGYLAGTDPTADNDELDTAGIGAFFALGSSWLNYNSGAYWRCLDGAAGAAVWQNIAGSLPTIVAAGTNVSVAFDGIATYTVSASGGGAAAPLTLQPGADATIAVALKQHSNTQSGPLLETLDSGGTQFGPRITGDGTLSNPSTRTSTGTNNEGFGAGALRSLTSGTGNTAFGFDTAQSITTGNGNVAVGRSALKTCGGGSYNSMLGSYAGNKLTNGNDNVGIGRAPMKYLTTGSGNVMIGKFAGKYLSSGGDNVGIGTNAHFYDPGGSANVAIGKLAGYPNQGSNNTFLGTITGCTGGTFNNATAIGASAKVTASNQIMMGTSSETVHFPGHTSGILAADISGLPGASHSGVWVGNSFPSSVIPTVGTFTLDWSLGGGSPIGYDTASFYSGANPTRLTIPTTGKYSVNVSCLIAVPITAVPFSVVLQIWSSPGVNFGVKYVWFPPNTSAINASIELTFLAFPFTAGQWVYFTLAAGNTGATLGNATAEVSFEGT